MHLAWRVAESALALRDALEERHCDPINRLDAGRLASLLSRRTTRLRIHCRVTCGTGPSRPQASSAN